MSRGDITELAQQVVELGEEKMTVEYTSDYGRIWYDVREEEG